MIERSHAVVVILLAAQWRVFEPHQWHIRMRVWTAFSENRSVAEFEPRQPYIQYRITLSGTKLRADHDPTAGRMGSAGNSDNFHRANWKGLSRLCA